MTLKSHFDSVGGVKVVAEWVNLTPKAIYKWCDKDELPQTEYSGRTIYSEIIEQKSKGVVLKSQLLLAGLPKHNKTKEEQ